LGDIVGGIIGGIGSLFGSNQAASKENEAAGTALTGYNYLSGNPLIQQSQSNATTAMGNQNAALGAAGQAIGGQAGTVNDISQLLTSNGTNNPAFQNYLNSTGYNFQVGQGEQAINNNAAAKGLLNSGATAKALTSYGQGTAAQSFNNYLGQLGTTANLQGSNATALGSLAGAYGGQVAQGLTSATAVGQAGTTGGANAGQFQAQAGQSIGSGTANAFNILGGTAQNALPSSSNFFSAPSVPIPSFY
jgi:hypothetical protein